MVPSVNPWHWDALQTGERGLTRGALCLGLQVISFLKVKEGFIGLVLKHIDASAMMDLLLRLISCVEPAPLRQEVLHVSVSALPSVNTAAECPAHPVQPTTEGSHSSSGRTYILVRVPWCPPPLVLPWCLQCQPASCSPPCGHNTCALH